MQVKTKMRLVHSHAVRISIDEDDREVGRAWLYVMRNDLQPRYIGYIEDVYVDESCRGRGVGKALIEAVIDVAIASGCYKLVATSRFERERVHRFYLSLGFHKKGFAFRMDL